MKAHLMFRDHDFGWELEPLAMRPWTVKEMPKMLPHEEALTQDLELTTLFRAIAGGDEFLFQAAKLAMFSGLQNDVETILYRQAIFKDCLRNESVVRNIYDLAVEATSGEKRRWLGIASRFPGAILSDAVRLLQVLMDVIAKLKCVADEQADKFESEGLTTLFKMLKAELADDYFAAVKTRLKELEFHGGVLMSAELGAGNQGVSYVLRQSIRPGPNWFHRIFSWNSSAYTFHLDGRDEAGFRALSELRDEGINLVANAVAQATDHIASFFVMLRAELAFYVGCLNLHRELGRKGVPVCFPAPAPPGTRKHAFKEMRDVCLALAMDRRVAQVSKPAVSPTSKSVERVAGERSAGLETRDTADLEVCATPPQTVIGNDLDADEKKLFVITGANQGGKSTFLRSIGIAQLMMQCGMFVTAQSFSADLCRGLFTHYIREEDAGMKSGKFDEELDRMSGIVDALTPDSLLLFNESFAATNEREGSEVATQIVRALLESRVKIFFVTHLYQFAHGLWKNKMNTAIFLRAERQSDGQRTFKLLPGEPLETSYGTDLYREIFESGKEREVLNP